jgi:general stress protein YciG
MKKKDKSISDYLARIGSKGGTARAKKHSKDQLSEWGKKGGRPRKKADKE